jgi:hypothetical protein
VLRRPSALSGADGNRSQSILLGALSSLVAVIVRTILTISDSHDCAFDCWVLSYGHGEAEDVPLHEAAAGAALPAPLHMLAIPRNAIAAVRSYAVPARATVDAVPDAVSNTDPVPARAALN